MDHKTFFFNPKKGVRLLSIAILLLGSFLYWTTAAQPQDHGAALSQEARTYWLKTQRICQRSLICDKVVINGTLEPKDKYLYLAMMDIVLKTVDSGLTSAWYSQVSKALEEVVINTSWWDRRWSANRTRITLNVDQISSYNEFLQVFTHELGHIVDLGVLQWTKSEKNTYFTEFGKVVFAINDPSFSYYSASRYAEDTRHIGSRKEDFCSGYAMTNPFEDFAECFNLYMNHNAYFQTLAKTNDMLAQKYNNIDEIFDGNYLLSNTRTQNLGEKNGTSRRGRDTTRLVR